MIPTWISDGRSTIRPMMSAPSSSVGATTVEYGSSQRCSGPVQRRTMCGTVSPTKPIGPQAATAVPGGQHDRQRAQDAGARHRRAEGAGGVLAERQGVQRAGAAEATARSATIANGAMSAHRGHVPSGRASRPPRSGTGRASGRRASRIEVVNALSTAAVAIPASARRTGAAAWRPMLPSP